MPPTCLQIGVILGFVLTNGILQLVPIQSSPQKVQGLSCSYTLKTKLNSQKFPGEWWLFWMQNWSCYGAEVAEERTWE